MLENLSLDGVKLIQPKAFYDERGFFCESYQKPLYVSLGIDIEFMQDNHSYSTKGVLRGMHFQRVPGQAKLISVIKGKIFDVMVDIRPTSPTFGRYLSITLCSQKHEQLFIPVGFAHGFCVLSEEAHVLYKVSSVYDPEEEKGFRFDDPDIAIQWPEIAKIISRRDSENPSFREVICDCGF